MSVDTDSLRKLVEAAVRPVPAGNLGIAVSGGGDSTALLSLLAAFRSDINVVTVDHGLRDESAHEANAVAVLCQSLGVTHSILKWGDWSGEGNLQAQARNARYELITEWAKKNKITHVALGHTLDDQAETFLLRLSRGSGVDGLAAMAPERTANGMTWLRPLLSVSRETLRAYLRQKKVRWIDDPSNDNERFDRIKMRKALPALAELGLTMERIAATADRMQSASIVLGQAAIDLCTQSVDMTAAGEISVNLEIYDAAPEELQLRLLAGIIQWMSGDPYRPRLSSLQTVRAAQVDKSLAGCLFRRQTGKLIIRREVAQVAGPIHATETVWDNRWNVDKAPSRDGHYVGALGEKGLQQCENWRDSGHARETLLTTPALWHNDRVIAAPLAGLANSWACQLESIEKGLHKVLLTR